MSRMSLRAFSSPRPGARRAAGRWAAGACAALMAALPPLSAYAQSGEQVSLIRDAEVEDILHQDTDPVLRAAGLEPSAVHIRLVGDKEVSAFVAGGQQIFLNTGMIIETENPGQLR